MSGTISSKILYECIVKCFMKIIHKPLGNYHDLIASEDIFVIKAECMFYFDFSQACQGER